MPIDIDPFPPKARPIKAFGTLPQLFSPTAPVYTDRCTNIAHAVNRLEVLLARGVSVVGAVVCFPDQLNGISDAEAGIYHNVFVQRFGVVDEFYGHFLGLGTVSAIQAGYVMTKLNYGSYDEFGQSGMLLNEIRPQIFERTAGTPGYPILCVVYSPNGNSPMIFGARGRNLGSFGEVILPPDSVLTENNPNRKLRIHEVGHAFGLPHNTANPDSIMNPVTLYNGQPKLLDASDIKDICDFRKYFPVMLGKSSAP